jgi:hypothetical protein
MKTRAFEYEAGGVFAVELAGRYSNPSDQVETVKMLAAQALKREEPRREAEGLPLGGGR